MTNTSVYIITQATKAIYPADSSYYRSIILEGSDQRKSVQRPEQIIDNSCLLYGAALSGRRTAVKDILKVTSKLPIPVIPENGVYMFPTSAAKSKDCVWLSFHHIKSIDKREGKTYVAFRDGSGLYVNASESTMNFQKLKTCELIVHLNRSILFGRRSNPFNQGF
ncbi:competence protein ComK [Virgibacillus sp. DJP39]|uniref:competence protein ComK n=1 Tax=Virgibacillus sp. DJP39 TaxID=3409790 RepID=UPI003BB81433